MKQKLLKVLYRFLAFCARIYLARTKPLVIWVTGSVWKTSCRLVLSQVLSQLESNKKIYTSPKNYNSELGLVFSIFRIEEYAPSFKNLLKISWEIFKKSLLEKKQYDILIAEYGIDTPGDMDFLLSIMKPDIGIITKLDSVHSDNFPGGTAQLWQDKIKLLLASKDKVYFNGQDEFSLQNESYLSIDHEKIFVIDTKTQLQKSELWLIQSFTYKGKNVSINLLWNENIEYTILAMKIAADIGIDMNQENYSFQFELQAGRFSIFNRNENIFIDSSYNAGPESMKKVIENTKLVQSELYPNHKIIYVLWDMREIGKERESAHVWIAKIVSDAVAVMFIWPDMYNFALPELKKNNFVGDIHSSLSSREAGRYLKKYLKDHSDEKYVVLFKGSQNTIFTEEALAAQLTPTQQKNLPRRSKDWMAKKNEFFKSL